MGGAVAAVVATGIIIADAVAFTISDQVVRASWSAFEGVRGGSGSGGAIAAIVATGSDVALDLAFTIPDPRIIASWSAVEEAQTIAAIVVTVFVIAGVLALVIPKP